MKTFVCTARTKKKDTFPFVHGKKNNHHMVYTYFLLTFKHFRSLLGFKKEVKYMNLVFSDFSKNLHVNIFKYSV